MTEKNGIPQNTDLSSPVQKTLEKLTLSTKNGSNNGTDCESNSVTPLPGSFADNFRAFAKFGDAKSDGKHITLSNSDKWMKQAKLIDGKKVTTTDTAICFKKLKSQKIGLSEYRKFLVDLARYKYMNVGDFEEKLVNSGVPRGGPGAVSGKAAATVNRLTDTSKYTGSHKHRFDETGKGRGIAGRKDLVDGSGYVTGFPNKNY